MLIMPFVPSLSPYDFNTPIDNASYHFDVRWNARANVQADGSRTGAWYFDIREIDNTPIALGVKVVIGAYLGRKHVHQLFSNGVFVAVDTEMRVDAATGRRGRRDPGFDELGARVRVLYVRNAEVAAGYIAMLANIRKGQIR